MAFLAFASFCLGTHAFRILEYSTYSNIQRGMCFFVLHKYNETNVYRMPFTVYYENELLKLVLLSSDECLPHAQLFEELRTVYGMPCTVYYENELSILVLLSGDECLLHAQLFEELRTVYGMPCTVYYKNELSKLVLLSSDECLLHAQLLEVLHTVYGMPCTVYYGNGLLKLTLLSSDECLPHEYSETQLFEFRNMYGISYTVYYENELLQLVLLPSDECLLHEYSENWNRSCNLMFNVNKCVESVISLYDSHTIWEYSQECVRATKVVHYKKGGGKQIQTEKKKIAFPTITFIFIWFYFHDYVKMQKT